MDDRQFKTLLHVLGYSFAGYRRVRKGVKKRIRRHMRDLGCRDMETYLKCIADSPAERETCIRRMTVPISRFMRDRPLWEAMEKVWLPDLHRRFGPCLRAWSAGCACGEEAYSLSIAHRESGLATAVEPVPELSIFATDINPAVLAKARGGVYPASSLREVPSPLRERYFRSERGGRRYRINPRVKAAVRWSCSDLTAARRGPAFHLLLLRNSILTYQNEPRKRRVITAMRQHLLPGGLLVIGLRETLPDGLPDLCKVAEQMPFVFRRIDPQGPGSHD